MEGLKYFLQPQEAEHQQRAVSERFCDENGQPVLWELRAVTAEENEYLIRKNLRWDEKRGENRLDVTAYKNDFAACGVVQPDLESEALQRHYGVMGASALLKKMLLAGEFAALYTLVSRLSGFETTLTQEADEVKNASGRA